MSEDNNEEYKLDENKFLLKVKEDKIPMDLLNQVAEDSLANIEAIVNKKVVIKTILSYWEGVITGYDMFQIHFKRHNGEELKIILNDITEVKLLE